jgi:hypothetical protein
MPMYFSSKESLGVEIPCCCPCPGEQFDLNPLARDRDELKLLKTAPDLGDWTEVKWVRQVIFDNKNKTCPPVILLERWVNQDEILPPLYDGFARDLAAGIRIGEGRQP